MTPNLSAAALPEAEVICISTQTGMPIPACLSIIPIPISVKRAFLMFCALRCSWLTMTVSRLMTICFVLVRCWKIRQGCERSSKRPVRSQQTCSRLKPLNICAPSAILTLPVGVQKRRNYGKSVRRKKLPKELKPKGEARNGEKIIYLGIGHLRTS